MIFKNALVSVSNKDGLIEFLKPLVAQGLRVVSTGGTSLHLRQAGIPVVEVAEQTSFPEVMDGRVRTLHPRIHMPLLARSQNQEDQKLLAQHGLDPFDLVIVNLYPFVEAQKRGIHGQELIEYIDIGGPSLLRAAAKNHASVAVVCDPQDYPKLLLRAQNNQPLTYAERQSLAQKVFEHTSHYDQQIARAFQSQVQMQSQTVTPSFASTSVEQNFLAGKGQLVQKLRYGENPQQSADWYSTDNSGLHQAQILQGKELSYNNLLDLDAALRLIYSIGNDPAAVVVKHNNACGAASASSSVEAIRLALAADPVSAFGGIVALNQKLDTEEAKLLGSIFLECIIAPQVGAGARELLAKKKDLRILEWPAMLQNNAGKPEEFGSQDPVVPRGMNGRAEVRSICGGYLLQSPDLVCAWPSISTSTASQAEVSPWKLLSPAEISPVRRRDLALAWQVCANLKSNAIALVALGSTRGLGMGQVNRVDAVDQAIARWKKHHADIKAEDIVLASDAFFPFPDSIDRAADAGIQWIIQPGGSVRDEQVVSRARERGVNMILTGRRHFRH